MIEVTRFNNQKIIINAEMIEFVESTPDTAIHMDNGKTHLVKEDVKSIVDKVLKYRRDIHLLTETIN
ncbi:MAG: flagellar protein FlbD [Ignavibacteria bacterium]|nr:flagellar protein FlbD [Ignavibacteria bacterium]